MKRSMLGRWGVGLAVALAAWMAAILGLTPFVARAAAPDPIAASQWGLTQIRAQSAWPTTRGAGITIAIVDSGIDFSHPDLSGKVLPGKTFLECGSAGCGDGGWQSGPSPRGQLRASNHGTHVAGIAAAVTDNGMGIAGVAPEAKLLPVKVIDRDGGSFVDIGVGIRFAVDQGARVINLSLGIEGELANITFRGSTTDASAAIAYAHSKGAIVVASAGNDTLPFCTSPAVEPGVVCVAATDKREAHSFYSNFGSDPNFLAVSAPGGSGSPLCFEDVVSTVPASTAAEQCGYGAGYIELAGTSMSAPHVSGVAALLAAQGRSRQNLLGAIRTTSRNPTTGARGSYDPIYGYGIVDAAAAVATTPDQPGTVLKPPSPPTNVQATAGDGSASVQWTPGPSDSQIQSFRVVAAPGGASSTTAGNTTSTTVTGLSNGTAYTFTVTATSEAGTSEPSAPSNPVTPQGGKSVARLAGQGRVETAVEVSRSSFPSGGADTVVLARADQFADALAGTPLAHARGAPLLLTPSDRLADAAETELKRVLAQGKAVHLLGGETALSSAVENRVEDLGYFVTRHQGNDRYATAVAVAEALGSPPDVFLTTGLDFADALGAGAAAAAVDGAVVLTAGSTMPESTRAYLVERQPARRYAVGGPAANADPSAERIAGNDRYDTARRLAERFFPSPPAIAVASGEAFADALSGGAHIAKRNGPLLLTLPTSLPTGSRDYLAARRSTITTGFLYGGQDAVSESVRQAIVDAIRG